MVALRNHQGACAALLNPSSAEPIVWPSPLKFISELNQDAKALLERALMEANKEREKTILKGSSHSLSSPSGSDSVIDDRSSEVLQSDFYAFSHHMNMPTGNVFSFLNLISLCVIQPRSFLSNLFLLLHLLIH